MKLRENIEFTESQLRSIRNLLNYSMADVNDYSELTKREKGCISEEVFNELFEDGKY